MSAGGRAVSWLKNSVRQVQRVRFAAVSRALVNASYLGLCLLLGGTVASAPRSARAQEPEISWRAPAACPSAEVVRERVAALLSRQPSTATRLRATGEITRAAAEGYLLKLSVNTQGHVAARTLRASDCAALAEAGAWLIALAVDPTLVDARAAPALEPKPKETKPDAPQPKPPEEAKPTPPANAKPKADEVKPKPPEEPEPAVDSSDEPERDGSASDVGDLDGGPPAPRAFRAGLLGGLHGSGLPGPVGSLGARVGLLVGGIYGELAAAHLFSREALLTNGGRVAFSGQLLRVRGCYEWGERFRIAPCAGLTGLRSVGEAKAIAQPGSEQTFWLVTGLALQLAYTVRTPFEVIIDAGADLPLSARPRFEVPGYGEVVTGNFVSGHTTFGFGVRY